MAEDLIKVSIQKNLSDTKPKKRPHSPVDILNVNSHKLPLASTKTELVWGCLEVEDSASQEFILKNKSNSKIEFKCSVNNSSFWLVKEGSYFSSTKKVILHPYESQTLAVTFAPTAQGSAVDNLHFLPIHSRDHLANEQFIRLFGYGGKGNVTVKNVFKDKGNFLLPMGNVEGQKMMKKVFSLKNNGTLPSFAHVSFVSNGLDLFSCVRVTPQALVLLAEEEKEVAVMFTLQQEHLNHLKTIMNSPVIESGKLELLCGSEVDRGRLRQLYKKTSEEALPTNPDFKKLLEVFPGEAMPKDLKLMREPISALEDIMRLITKKEITITLEQDLDGTLEQLHNDTAIFHSLWQNTNLDAFKNIASPDICTLEPSKIILIPPENGTNIILLNNGNTKQLSFKAMSNPEGLGLSPNRGTVQPGETVIINVSYNFIACRRMTVFKVKVIVANKCFDVDVKVYNFNKLK